MFEGAGVVMRKVMNGLVVAMLAVPALVIGQAGDVNKVLADMRAALGGADKVAAVKTLTAVGRTLRTNQAGTTSESEFELAMEMPDKYMMRTVLANMGQMSIYRNAGFNGNGLINLIDQPPSLGGGGGGGMQIITRMAGPGGAAPGATPTPEQKAESDRLQVLAQKRDFARLALGLLGSSFAAYPLEFSYAGEAEAADGKAFVVDVKGAEDFTARLFVDARTNLPLMLSWTALEPLVMQQTVNRGGGSAEERAKLMEDMAARQKEAEANRKMVEHRVHYSNFRTVNGLKMPHTLQRSVAGKPTEEMTFEAIKINPKIDAKKFEVTK
jgi:outer membrane lipoprotein-sorting protein